MNNPRAETREQLIERLARYITGGSYTMALSALETLADKVAKPLTAQLVAANAEIERLSGYLERAGWGRCDIPACNCGGYHKLRESKDERELREAKDAEIAELKARLDKVGGITQEIKQVTIERNEIADELISSLRAQLAEAQKLLQTADVELNGLRTFLAEAQKDKERLDCNDHPPHPPRQPFS